MIGRFALVLVSLTVGLGLLELGCRLVRGPASLMDWSNIVLAERRATRSVTDSRMIHDAELGFVGRPGYASRDTNNDSKGYRFTPSPEGLNQADRPILVVGDSYAQGDEVEDNETWATLAQPLLQRRMINAGVSGYGLDQAILRAERSAAEEWPAAIVLIFIAEDLRRSEMKRVWGVEKPYFELHDGSLAQRNAPVALPPDPASTLDTWQRLLGWSVLVDTILRHKGWQYEWSIDHARATPRGTGEILACPLIDRLANLGVPTLVVAAYDPYVWKDAEYAEEQRRLSRIVLACAERAGLASLDLFTAIDSAVKSFGHTAIFRSSHPGPAGHRIAAERIAAALAELHIPPR